MKYSDNDNIFKIISFKIKFKFNFEGNYFSFKNTKNLIHNHTPNSSNEQKVRYFFPFFYF